LGPNSQTNPNKERNCSGLLAALAALEFSRGFMVFEKKCNQIPPTMWRELFTRAASAPDKAGECMAAPLYFRIREFVIDSLG
jgi:hypothetical protein